MPRIGKIANPLVTRCFCSHLLGLSCGLWDREERGGPDLKCDRDKWFKFKDKKRVRGMGWASLLCAKENTNLGFSRLEFAALGD